MDVCLVAEEHCHRAGHSGLVSGVFRYGQQMVVVGWFLSSLS